jgi:antitoxin component of MazEF toxin-antitoxin module
MTDDNRSPAQTNRLSRRSFLVSGSVTTVALAGCIGGDDSGNGNENGDEETPAPPDTVEGANVPDAPEVENPPNAVYLPTHREAMEHLSTIETGEFAVTPMLTYPHKFWLVTGDNREVVNPTVSGVHMMATVWDSQTGAVLPVDMGAQMRTYRDGEQVDQRAPWPMISQPMGFHFGDNIGLPGPGTYTVEIDMNPIEARKTGEFAGRFEETETATFEFEFDAEFRRSVVEGVEYFEEDRWGERGALEPMGMGGGMSGGESGSDGGSGGMGMPYSALQQADAYPGQDLGTPTSGDATFVVRYLEESRLAEGASGYLLVSPRTPYNRVPLADMALSVTGSVEGDLVQTLDSEVGHHYGISTDLVSGDRVELVVDSPPQVARHRGYETAFLEMPSMTVEVP